MGMKECLAYSLRAVARQGKGKTYRYTSHDVVDAETAAAWA
jgi:hypothetical protein